MVKLNKIYTRTGDAGTTGLVDGSRVAKSSPLIAAIGDVDEANSAIGVARLHSDGDVAVALRRLQNDLFDLGADLATPAGMDGALRIVPAQVARLEAEIDAMTAALQPLTSFVLPGGTPARRRAASRPRHHAARRARCHRRRARAQRARARLSQPPVRLAVLRRADGERGGRKRHFVATWGNALTLVGVRVPC